MAESLDATFFAFRKREKGGVLIGASIAFVIVSVVLIGVFVAAMWSSLAPVMTWYMQVLSVSAQGDPNAVAAMTPPGAIFLLGPAYLLFLFAFFVLLAAFEAACLRWMIHGQTGGLMGLTLGADTWRVYATYWVWFFFFLFAYLGLILFAVLVGGVGGAAGGEQAAGVTIGAVVLGCLAYAIAWLYVSVRLAPAAATSVGRGAFSFFSAWTVTRDRFWALFGAFLLLILIVLVAGTILSTIFFTIVLGAAMSNLDPTMASTNPDAFMQAYFGALMSVVSNPASIATFAVFQVISWAVHLMLYVLFYGVNARAVRAALDEGKITPAVAA